jgi:transposase
MLQFTISEEDKKAIDKERFQCTDRTLCRRLHALYLKSIGKSHKEISEFVGLSPNALTGIFKIYAKHGLSAVRQLAYVPRKSPLEDHRELLHKHFEEHPPASVKQACDDIERLTGIKKSPTRIRTFLHQLGMKPRKVGGFPSKANPEQQEEFKKKPGTSFG